MPVNGVAQEVTRHQYVYIWLQALPHLLVWLILFSQGQKPFEKYFSSKVPLKLHEDN